MTVVDWVLVVVWLGLTLGGFWKGAVRIIFGGGGLAAGLWLAVVAGADAQAALEGVIGIPWLSAIAGRILLVVLCTGLALLAGWGIEHLKRRGVKAELRRRQPKNVLRPYRRAENLLLDYLKLIGLLQKRANSLYELEEWEEVAPPGEVPARHIQAQIDAHLERMHARLDRDEHRSGLAPVQFIDQLIECPI